MKITEVKVEFTGHQKSELRAYCYVVIDDAIVIREVKILARDSGFFVAMPSRRSTEPCGHCGAKYDFNARFCSQCGQAIMGEEAEKSNRQPYRDIVHPISATARRQLEAAVMAEFVKKLVTDEAGSHTHEGLSAGRKGPLHHKRSAGHRTEEK